MSADYLKFSPEILARLGEELIPHPDQGLIELVRNSYDADATNCTIELKNTGKEGGTISISDDGIGMSESAISSGWLLIGRSQKTSHKRTDLGRLQVGDKGLGRLAALRMGTQVALTTRPKDEKGIEYALSIDWAKYDKVDFVEKVPITITKSKTSTDTGTDILLQNLRIPLGRREIDRIARQLVLLANPFDDTTGFRPCLVAPGFKDLERKVRERYFSQAHFHLKATVNDKGYAEAQVLDWKNKQLWSANHKALSKSKYKTIPAEFDLWTFLLLAKNFSDRTASVQEVKDWLKVTGGVHLYYRGLRVRPYGDSGHDWLEMNLARTRSPEERPATYNSIGRVVVDDIYGRMIQKTDRIGFIESETFTELKRFCKDALEWMASERLKDAEKRRRIYREQSTVLTNKARKEVSKLIENIVPQKQRPAIIDAFQKYEKAITKKEKSLEEDLQLYRSLATAGTTYAVFAHESAKPVTRIKQATDSLEIRIKHAVEKEDYSNFEKPIKILRNATDSLRSYASFPLYLLKKEKRIVGDIDVHKVLNDIIGLFEPFMSSEKIDVEQEYTDATPYIHGTIALLEAIFANLLTNAINAFTSPNSQNKNRKVLLRTEISGELLLIKVIDNGQGIKMNIDEIWLPGKTTTPGGTGFGLTIVKDAVADLSGKAYALAKGELGGAEFTIELPLLRH